MSRYYAFFALLTACGVLFSCPINAQTIAEKKAQLTTGGADLDREAQEALTQTNSSVTSIHAELQVLHDKAFLLHEQGASNKEFQNLLIQINSLRNEVSEIEESWRLLSAEENRKEKYALWQQPETTIEQLVIDYGSQDYVYLMTEDVGSIIVSVNSELPIPRASWAAMLETILNQNGIGIRQLNPFLRELYLLKDGRATIHHITNQRQDLQLFPREARVAFVLSPDPEDVRRTWFFLDKFINPNSTILELVGRDILIISQVGDILELLKLYDFVVTNRANKEYRLVPVYKVNAEEMAKILGAVFDQVADITKRKVDSPEIKEGEPLSLDTNGLQIVLLESISQALFLVGTKEEVSRAEQLVREVEAQIGGPQNKTIFWYTVKHSNPDELAEVLQRIYTMMVSESIGDEYADGERSGNVLQQVEVTNKRDSAALAPIAARQLFEDSYFQSGSVAVNPAPVTLTRQDDDKPSSVQFDNFIVDLKTSTIVMVVDEYLLSQLKEVIKKLDVPKKMVKIDILLFEKRTNDTTNYGLNLLRIGGKAADQRLTSLTFNNVPPNGDGDPSGGIFSFFLSRTRTDCTPAYDLVYQFLLQQQDIQINANPSITTINQTPAKIAIVDEISLDTGTYVIGEGGLSEQKRSFTRAQYGITLEITPTIHMRDDDHNYWDPDVTDYISLETIINFDTVQPSLVSRPDVTRRNITNEVIVPDGQTVILGGLRRKDTADTKESIPFLGELPCLGKLFSETTMSDQSVEMFIFITPKIVDDPCKDLERIKYEELLRRPGDVPDFMFCLNEARKYERHRSLRQSMQILCGRPPDPPFKTLIPCEDGPWHDLDEHNGGCGGNTPWDGMREYNGRY